MSLKTTIRQSVFDIYRWTYSFNLSYVRTRTELPIILNRRSLTGKGVEVGVWKGEFSIFLLENWKGEKLYSVDPWKNFASDEYVDDMNIDQNDFDEIYNGVSKLLTKYDDRSEIIRDVSTNAALSFEDNSLDFVYLDGRHDYEGVKEDIQSWYSKVKPGGLLSGHDYLDGIIGKTDFGVKKAVDEFSKNNQLKLLVTDRDEYPSWFILKH